jgi:hypothetical protein
MWGNVPVQVYILLNGTETKNGYTILIFLRIL